MFRKVLMLTAVVLVFSACEVEAAVIDSNWVGGQQGQWNQASNWNPATVPDNGGDTFAVTIDSGSNGVDWVEVGLQQWRTIDQLDCYGEVELGAWTPNWMQLTLVGPNGLTNYGDLEIGQININGNVTNYGDLEFWEHINIHGNLINHAGGTLVFDDHDVDIEGADGGVGGVVENDGVIICTRGGGPTEEVLLNNRGSIQLFNGHFSNEGVFDNNSTGHIEGWGDINSSQLIRNKGTLFASSGVLFLSSQGAMTNTGTLGNKPLGSLHIKPAEDVNNQGTIEVNGGGGVAFDCNVVNDPNALIQLRGGFLAASNITQKAGATFEGFGGITGNVVIEPNSASEPNSIIRLTGPTNIVGDVNIESGATLEISDGTTLVTGDCVCNNGTIRMVGGRIIIQGDFTNDNCNIIWQPGTYANAADFNLDGLVNFKDFADFADTWLWESAWH